MLRVECPHCEATFQLDPDTIGKAIRCPECKEPFTATAATPAPPPLPKPVADEPMSVFELHTRAAPLPYERVERDDVRPVLETEAAPRAPLPAKPLPAKPLAPAADDIPTLAPKPAAPKATPAGPKEVVWRGDAPPMPTAGRVASPALTVPRAKPVADDETDPDEVEVEEELFVRRKRRRRSWGKTLFVLALAAVVITALTGGFGYWRYTALSEQRLNDAAQLAFDEGNFADAGTKYEQLLTDYPTSTDVERYRFFAALSGVHNALGGLSVRENPGPAREAFAAFVTDFGQSPLAMPESGYGAEVVQLGRKLLDTLADHAGDRLTAFRADRAKLGELDATAAAVADAEALVPTVDKFRSRDGVSLDPQRKRLTDLTAEVAAERRRLEILAPFRDIAVAPTAPRIEEFEKVLRDTKLDGDAEARAMLAAAEEALKKLFGYSRDRKAAAAPPADKAPPVLFSTRVGPAPRAGDPPPPGPTGDVVFGMCRGVLYALDAGTGDLLWGTRVAPPTADLRAVDVPVRVPMGGGRTEQGGELDWVLVAGDVAGTPALTARLARTGEPVWYQPLEARPAGRPVVTGGRIYLPLKDSTGTVVEFEAASGARTGELTLRQPVGGGLSLLPSDGPGGDLLVVPGDVKRTFLFQLGHEDAEGRRLPPRCVRVLLTDHPRDTLRGEAAVVAPTAEGGPRYLVLTQTDGPQAMKLRAFAVPSPADIVAAATDGPVSTSDKPAEVTVAGWSWFPAASDGERLVLASDAGAFFALGNADAPLFTLPAPPAPPVQEGVARSVVVEMTEDSYWAVLAGRLTRLRTAADPQHGLRIVAQGPGRVVGEPLHRAQVRPASNLGVIVCRTPGGAAIQALGFDLTTGQPRWTRRLGVTPAGPPVALADSRALVVDEDGTAYAVPAAAKPGTPAPPSTVALPVAGPLPESTGRATVAASPDGQTVWVVTAETDKAGRRVRLRNLVNGKLEVDAVAPLPDAVAGPPVVLGPAVLIPLVNGYVYRFGPADTQLAVGPLCTHGPDVFYATDGGRKFLRWRWPGEPGAKPAKLAGPWEVPGRVALPPVGLDAGSGPLVAAADASGVVLLFDATKVEEALRRWRGTGDGPIPLGRPTLTLAAVPTPAGVRLVYSIADRTLVGLATDRVEPAWVTPKLLPETAGELLGVTVTGGEVLASDPAGRVIVLDAATGKATDLAPLPGQSLAAAPATGVGNAVLQLGLDGTGTRMPRK
jgi:predicted Zn finger-like uncharacterized protein